MTDSLPATPRTSALSRRSVLLGAGGAAGLVVGAGSGYVARGDGQSTAAGVAGAVTPGEMLMQEHGVLKRTLLVYEAIVERARRSEPFPAATLHGAAEVIHDFIEGFHEALEEAYVFPALRAAGTLVSTVDTLLLQHAAGRRITQDLLAMSQHSTLDAEQRDAAVVRLDAFVRMYQPHEAREDTVVFPAYRSILGDAKLAAMAEHFEALQTQQLGRSGFQTALDKVSALEDTLGIGDLASFTPTIA